MQLVDANAFYNRHLVKQGKFSTSYNLQHMAH